MFHFYFPRQVNKKLSTIIMVAMRLVIILDFIQDYWLLILLLIVLQDDIAVKHCTNAYMLVYIRDCDMSK
jgi:hypothetical protein